MNHKNLIDQLAQNHILSADELEELLSSFSPEDQTYAASIARKITETQFGNTIYIRGLIEFSNYCKNDCYYCGIRKSNSSVSRYRLSCEDILDCCKLGYHLGFRTFVLQSGEDLYFSDEKMVVIIEQIHHSYPDCAITLSIGEKSFESYQKYYQAGASRYLLRHETASEPHYQKLHPSNQTFRNRINCLQNLKKIGYQTGCGFMVGSPFQTYADLAKDLLFIADFKPHMVGIGPFISHKDTPFSAYANGSLELSLILLSLIRIMLPNVLLPATTALGTLSENGRIQGILSGANVVMPNLSPMHVRAKYMLYDNKLGTGEESAEGIEALKKSFEKIGRQIVVDRGDFQKLLS